MQEKKTWRHKSTFILAAAGAAIGLGNIWKFPYMVGESGGGAFVLIYLLCIILISLPLMIAESVVGRYAQKNPFDAIRQVAEESKLSRHWTLMATVGMISLFLIFSFFSVVGGWSFAYAVKSFSGVFDGLGIQEIGNAFNGFLSQPKELIFWHSVFTLTTALVVLMGIINGIEKGIRWLMPILLILISVMLVYSVFFSGGFVAGIGFLFTPDFSKITSDTVLKALGQAFFTLNVGLCLVMAYAAYTPKNVSLTKSAIIVVILDTLVALLMGVVIFPIVFANNLDPADGSGLLFVTLTTAFARLPAGQILGGAFFSLVGVAALTSSVAMVEGPVGLLEQKYRISRKILVPVYTLLGWAFGLLTVFSFNIWKEVKWLNKTLFNWIDVLTSAVAMPLVGLALLIFVGWRINAIVMQQELNATGDSTNYKLWRLMIRYVAPILVLITFVFGLHEAFF